MADDDELNIELLPQVQEQMDKDPAAAAAMKSFLEVLHQAHAGVQAGQYKTIDDGIEALTGNRPRKIVDGEEVEGSIHDELYHDDCDGFEVHNIRPTKAVN